MSDYENSALRKFIELQQLYNDDDDLLFGEQSLEQSLMNQIINPASIKRTRTNLIDNFGRKATISETRTAGFINDKGVYEEMQEDNIRMLDDGTSTCGVVICQTCGAVVKEENISRCKCGKTVCVRPNCGWKVSGKKYCSFWCSLFE